MNCCEIPAPQKWWMLVILCDKVSSEYFPYSINILVFVIRKMCTLRKVVSEGLYTTCMNVASEWVKREGLYFSVGNLRQKVRSSDIWRSHCGLAEGSSVLGCDAVSLGEWFPTFRRIIGNLSPNDTASKARSLESSLLADSFGLAYQRWKFWLW